MLDITTHPAQEVQADRPAIAVGGWENGVSLHQPVDELAFIGRE
jgi:hypothetical protein